MPRYYDMDKLAEMAQTKADTLLPPGNMAFSSVVKWLELLPAADVVPKSEIVRLQSKIKRLKKYDEERDIALHARLIASAKNETASEIFEEIEKIIDEKYNRFVFKGPYDSDEETEAIINFSDSVSDAIDALKNKYLEASK